MEWQRGSHTSSRAGPGTDTLSDVGVILYWLHIIRANGMIPKQNSGTVVRHQDLTRAIQGFPELKIITIDNLNLAITTDASEEFSHGKEICSCILSGATQVFQSLRLSTEPRLNLRISVDDASPYTHLFDPRVQSWKEYFAPKVSSLALVTHDGGDHTWELDFLDSLRNLQHFDIEGNVPDLTWAKLSWHMLSTTELRDLYLPTDGFIAFIMRHSTTLSSVGLEEITLYGGTWVDPLQKVIEMKQLSRLSLCSLYQMDSSAKVPDSFELSFPAMKREVELLDRNDFGIAAEILNHHFWITTSDEPGDTRYLVDLRLVKAFVDGEIEFQHGQWKF
jgi:hypothetical protein